MVPHRVTWQRKHGHWGHRSELWRMCCMFRKTQLLFGFQNCTWCSCVARHCEGVELFLWINGEVGIVSESSIISRSHVHSQTHRANTGQVVQQLISWWREGGRENSLIYWLTYWIIFGADVMITYQARTLHWGSQNQPCIHSRFCRNQSFHSSSFGTPRKHTTGFWLLSKCIQDFLQCKVKCFSPSSHLHQSPYHSRLWLLVPLYLAGRYSPLLTAELHSAAPESTQWGKENALSLSEEKRYWSSDKLIFME